jgi:hypothetical protein
MSGSFDDHTKLSDDITLKYGVTMDNVTFLDRLNYMSPYARLTYDLGTAPNWTSLSPPGTPARNWPAPSLRQSADLQRDLNALGLFPRISVLNARTQVQRGDEYEATYSRKVGSRTYSATLDHEAVTNAALSLVGPLGASKASIFCPMSSPTLDSDAGNFHSWGYTGAVTQKLGEHVSVTLMYGGEGALTVDNRPLAHRQPGRVARPCCTRRSGTLPPRASRPPCRGPDARGRSATSGPTDSAGPRRETSIAPNPTAPCRG